MTISGTSTLTKEQFYISLKNFIEQLENSTNLPYLDTANKGIKHTTIGIGFDLVNERSRNLVFAAMGISSSDPFYERLIEIFNNPPQNNVTLRNLLNEAYGGEFSLTNNQIKEIFDSLVESDVNSVISSSGLGYSNELIALVSLKFNGLFGTGLQAALNLGNSAEARAEAWYQIRYEHADQLHKRRYIEASLFGLYGNVTITPEDARVVFGMFTKYRAKILSYESAYSDLLEAAQLDLNAAGMSEIKALSILDSLELGKLSLIQYLQQKYGAELNGVNLSSFSALAIQLGGAGQDVLLGAVPVTGMNFTFDTNDLLIGEEGSDALYGRGGNDVLIGGEGNDTLDGGVGNDTLIGGVGFDTYIWNAGDRDTIIDSDGQGVVKFRATDGTVTEVLLSGIFLKNAQPGEIYQLTLPNGDIATLSHNSPWRITMPDGSILELGEDFEDGDFGIRLFDDNTAQATYDREIRGDLTPLNTTSTDELGNLIVTATEEPGRADMLYGSAQNDHILGLAGDDHIEDFRGGDDKLDGGAGNDQILAGEGDDILIGGDGQDRLFGHSGDDYLYAQQEISLEDALILNQTQQASGLKGDFLDGGLGDDVLIGDAGHDFLNGSHGHDVLIGGGGNDNMYGDGLATNVQAGWSVSRVVTTGQEGNHYEHQFVNFDFQSSEEGGNDLMYGGAGDDWMFGGVGNDYLDGGTGNDVLFGEAGSDVLYGGDGDDVLIGDNPANTSGADEGDDWLYGGNGDDRLSGNGGNDHLYGEAGSDTLNGGTGDDYLDGGAGEDYLVGGDGRDTLIGGAGDDQSQGGDGNDILNGGDGDDILYGDDGDDELTGGAGIDYLDGGEGKDTYVFNLGDSPVINNTVESLNDVSTGNRIRFGAGIGAGDLKITLTPSKELILQYSVLDYVGISNGLFGSIEAVEFADGTVLDWGGVMAGYATSINVTATAESEIFFGGSANDYVLGMAGNDLLHGQGGNDVLVGGDGEDTLNGGIGNDFIYGDSGNDLIIGGEGDDWLEGGDGINTYLFNQGDGRDEIRGITGQHIIRFGSGITPETLQLDIARNDSELAVLRIKYGENDVVTIDGGVTGSISAIEFEDETTLTLDQLLDAAIKPVVYHDGTALPDLLDGGFGNDLLAGGLGNDSIYGWHGNDTLDGGLGYNYLNGGSGGDTYQLTLNGVSYIDDESGDDYELIRLPPGLQLSDFSASRTGNDLLLSSVSLSGNEYTAAVVKGFFSSSHSSKSWLIVGDQDLLTSLRDWAEPQLSIPAEANVAAYLKNKFNKELMLDMTQRGAEGESLSPIEDRIMGVNTTYSEGYWYQVSETNYRNVPVQYTFGGLTVNEVNVDNNLILLGSSQIDQNHIVYENQVVTETNPIYEWQFSGGSTYSIPIGNGASDNWTSHDVNTLLQSHNISITASNGNWVISLPQYGARVQVGTVQSSYVSQTVTGQVTRSYAVNNILGSSQNDHISMEYIDGRAVAFRGSVSAGDGDDYVNLGTNSSDWKDWNVNLHNFYYLNSQRQQGLGAFLDGGDGNDTLIGTDANDVLLGGSGNDFLDGGLGSDIYHVFFENADSDIIYDSGDVGYDASMFGSVYGAEYPRDEVVFGVGISKENLTWRLMESAYDGYNTMEIMHGQAKIIVVYKDYVNNDPFYSDYSGDSSIGIELFRFADGTLLTRQQFMEQVTELPGNHAPIVTDYIQDQDATDGSYFSWTVPDGLFFDSDENDQLTYSITLANGDFLPSWLVFDSELLTLSGTPTTSDIFNYWSVQITATDQFGVSVSTVFNLDVNPMDNQNIVGTEGDDILIGGSGNDVLHGALGNDTLDGGFGNDTMSGGVGDDVYIVDSEGDIVEEYAEQGDDTIQTSISYVLNNPNIENLTLTGTADINATGVVGNTQFHIITGNSGNNVIDGRGGNDVLQGGLGDDVYIVGQNYGANVILDTGGNDAIQFGYGISSQDIKVFRDQQHIYLTQDNVSSLTDLLDSSNPNYIVITGAATQFGVSLLIESVKFNDGTVWTAFDLWKKANIPSAGNDWISDNISSGFPTSNDYLRGLSGNDIIETLDGNDIILGDEGNDTLKVAFGSTGRKVLFGGEGNDTLTDGSQNGLLIGGAGNDLITTGSGRDVISFNIGDGQDIVNASTGLDNTLSLGGDISYDSLSFSKSGNNLILNVSGADSITFKDWYVSTSNRSVTNLQVIAEAMEDFDANGSNTLLDNKVERFNFAGLVSQFDAARAADSNLTTWQLSNALLDFHLGGSDSAAFGGDLAYQYGLNGNLTGIGLLAAQNVISSTQFGQSAQTLNAPSSWQAETVKLG